MLKKIVKYGNSCALVLDKALLELLNMEEGSIVKIKTDGISLIITPQSALTQQTVSATVTMEDSLKNASKIAIEQSFGDPEKAQAFQAAYKEVSDRYATLIKNKMEIPEVALAMSAVQKRFANDTANPEYAQEIKKVQERYIPELGQMNQEMDALAKKYTPINSQHSNASLLREEFTKVHIKYGHVQKAVVKLTEDPEFIHEMVLLAEKYQSHKDKAYTKEYFEAYTQLVSKNIPEYATYQEELKRVGMQFAEEAKAPTKTPKKKKQ